MTLQNMLHRGRAGRPAGVRSAHRRAAAAADSKAAAMRKAGITTSGIQRFASLPRGGVARRTA